MMLTAEQSLDKNLLINFSPLLIVAIFGFTMAIRNSCSTIEIIDGICYNEKDLSHLCEIEEPISKEECIRESECKYA